MDSDGKKAGKGALVQEELSGTLGVSQDQYLFQPIAIDNHPHDSRVTLSKDGKVQTLATRMGTGGGNVPLVLTGCYWDGSQTCGTLTARNAGGAQRMPDKDNFTARGPGAVCYRKSEHCVRQTISSHNNNR